MKVENKKNFGLEGRRKKKEKKALFVGSAKLFSYFIQRIIKLKRRTSTVEYRTLVNQIQSATRLL